MDDSPVTSPTSTPECPLVVVTGPTSLVKSSSSLSNTPLSDTERRPRLSDQGDGERSETHPASDEHSEPGALSDGELDRRAATNHRLLRPSRFTTRRKVKPRPSVVSTDSDISPLNTAQHRQLRVAESMPVKSRTLPRKRTVSKRPSRRVSCKDLGSGQCKGWLMKKSKSWVKRWFVLSRRSLYYYKTEEDVKAQGVIYLPGFKISPAPEIKSRKFAFKAHHSGTTFYFAAERQDDMAKWMNKLGLASLDDLELSEVATTAGFWKPPEMLPPPQTKSASYQDLTETESKSPVSFFSESEEDDHQSQHVSPTTSRTSSRDDITALYRDIERADLDLAGSNVRDRRSTMLLSVLSDDDEHRRDDAWRHLLSLNRTLKDREQVLAAIDSLLLQQPITSQHLTSFIVQHPDVVGLQGSNDDVPLRDSDSDIVPGDSVSLPADTSTADTADTSTADTFDTDSSISATPTRRRLLHNGVTSLSPLSPTDATVERKPRRPSQETSV